VAFGCAEQHEPARWARSRRPRCQHQESGNSTGMHWAYTVAMVVLCRPLSDQGLKGSAKERRAARAGAPSAPALGIGLLNDRHHISKIVQNT